MLLSSKWSSLAMEWNSMFVKDTSDVCMTCNGFYGPAFGRPLCATCHAFLYAQPLGALGNEDPVRLTSNDDVLDDDNDDVDRDSGNEDDDQPIEQQAQLEGDEVQGDEEEEEEDQGQGEEGVEMDDDEQENNNPNDEQQQQPFFPNDEEDDVAQAMPIPIGVEGVAGALPVPIAVDVDAQNNISHANYDNSLHDNRQNGSSSVPIESLSARLSLLCNSSHSYWTHERREDDMDHQLVHCLPPEVLTSIFVYLDDLSLTSAAQVCRRWQQVLLAYTSQNMWYNFTLKRWPLYKPLCKITDWFAVFSNLISSSFCLTCIYASHAHHNLQPMAHMADVMLDDNYPLPLREKRLGHDIRGLVVDPPEGIRAQPLDSSSFRWQASITGPAGSVYEGGLFFLLLTVPFAYPFQPPEVRFITKIFHPNVSRHGDIGIDILHQSWAPGFTIPKVLISIQSLLTDPYTYVCMEPMIGSLYNSDRKLFEAVARHWTRMHAMHDAIIPVLQ